MDMGRQEPHINEHGGNSILISIGRGNTILMAIGENSILMTTGATPF